MNVAVALFAFNRASTLAQVFERVRAARPETLLLICDGPRPHSPHECDEVKRVFESVDWPCDVRRNYAPENLGCRRRMISGMSWVFEQVPEAILLEDDCLPSPSFFPFAAEALARYRDDPRVMMVGGFNPAFDRVSWDASYTTARFTSIWGWASWARAWATYDENLSGWPRLRTTDWLRRTLQDPAQVRFWREKFDRVHEGEGTWDWQWTFSMWAHDGLAVIPAQHLVTNIGFGGTGTSGILADVPWIARLLAVPVGNLEFPLVHPERIEPNRELDRHLYQLAWAPQRSIPPEGPARQAWRMVRQRRFRELARKIGGRLLR